MKQWMASILTVFCLLSGLAFSAHAAQGPATIPGEYLVKYRGGQFAALTSLRSLASVRILDQNPNAQLLKVRVALASEPQTLARLMSEPSVEYVVPNAVLRAFRTPLETKALQSQWAIQKVNAEKAWQRAGNKGSRKVVVAVIDTGSDYNHESLKPNQIPGYDFKEDSADPMDKTGRANPGHGTHCSGIIGATGLVEGGIIGISPEVSMMPLRFLGEDGSGDLNAAIKAVDYAIQKKVDVVSASWGATISRSMAQPLIEAVKRLDDAGIIFVAAAANDGRNNDSTDVFPANAGFPNSITVAATGEQDEKPSWSNYGRRMTHLASPGLNIMSTLPGNKYGKLSGTSMATPLVAGLVAFLKAQEPSLTGRQVRALLQQTGAKAQVETACNCRIDAYAAVDKLIAKQLFITPAAGSINVGELLQFEGTNGQAPFTFSVSNTSVASISDTGLLQANAAGETTVTVKDNRGQTATSLTIYVASKSGGGGGGGGNDDDDNGGGWPMPKPPGGGGGGGGWPIPKPPGDGGGGGGGWPMPNPPGGGGGGGGNCPLGDQQMCDSICQIQPTLPFCRK